MEAPEKIKIGKYNITSDGDVVFWWVTNEPDCEAMQHDIEYIRKDVLLEWLTFHRSCAKKGSIAMNLYQQVIDKIRGL